MLNEDESKEAEWIVAHYQIYDLYIYIYIYICVCIYSQILRQGCKNPSRQIIRAIKFCTMVPNICEHSAGNFCMSFFVAWNFYMYLRFLGNLCTYVLRWRERESKHPWLNLTCIYMEGLKKSRRNLRQENWYSADNFSSAFHSCRQMDRVITVEILQGYKCA